MLINWKVKVKFNEKNTSCFVGKRWEYKVRNDKERGKRSITDVSYDDIKDDNEQVHINLEVLSENDENTIYNILFRDELEN